MPGQQAGHAIADCLFGKTNPSGKLPLTMPNKENEQDFTKEQWPGAHKTYTDQRARGAYALQFVPKGTVNPMVSRL